MTNSIFKYRIWFWGTSLAIVSNYKTLTEALIIAWSKSWETNTSCSVPIGIGNTNTFINSFSSTLNSIEESSFGTETSTISIFLSKCTFYTFNTIVESIIWANTLRNFIIPNFSLVTWLIWNTFNSIIVRSWWASIWCW